MLKRLFFLLLMLPMSAYCAHITDKLLAGMYAQPNSAEQPVQLLPSGTPVELLTEQKGFVKVQLVDGKTGWVEKRFLSEEKPAKVRLLALQSKYRQLQGKLDALEKKLLNVEQPEAVEKRNSAETQAIRQSEQVLMINLETANSVIEELKREAKLLAKRHALELEGESGREVELVGKSLGNSEAATPWVMIIMMLIVGIATGIYVVMDIQDKLQLKRHVGFRV
jgi:SH3 domain protein